MASQKFSLAEQFASLDTNSKSVWDELDEEQRKEVKFWLMNRYMSSVEGNREEQEHAIFMTNEMYNKNFNVLGTKHAKLQWQLLCSTHNDKSSIRGHKWIGFKKKTSDNSKGEKLLHTLVLQTFGRLPTKRTIPFCIIPFYTLNTPENSANDVQKCKKQREKKPHHVVQQHESVQSNIE